MVFSTAICGIRPLAPASDWWHDAQCLVKSSTAYGSSAASRATAAMSRQTRGFMGWPKRVYRRSPFGTRHRSVGRHSRANGPWADVLRRPLTLVNQEPDRRSGADVDVRPTLGLGEL